MPHRQSALPLPVGAPLGRGFPAECLALISIEPKPFARRRLHGLNFPPDDVVRRDAWVDHGRTAVTSISISQPGLTRPATCITERDGRFGCWAVPKNWV
jgi:hypothetical protein